jgi:nicotinate-nucleotide--dimethylbenzimidazole phosphoribosyltransferase
MNLPDLIASIPPLDQKAMQKAEKRQARLTRPAKSLGWLEEIAIQVAGITGREIPLLGKKRVFLCAADHGLSGEGSPALFPKITPATVLKFLQGGAAVNALARQAGAEVQVVDVGVAADIPKHKQLLSAKIARGTGNFRVEAAMTESQCLRALELGIQLATQAKKDKIRWVVLGEIGTASSISAAALMAALLPAAIEDVMGFGGAMDRTQWMSKCRIIQEGLRLHQPQPSKPLEALRRLGGLELAVLAGVVLGCAKNRIPVVADGFISSAAFLAAYRLAPKVLDFTFFSHFSEEPGHAKFYEMLQTGPILDLDLRLGEGTGGVLALNILESAVRVHAQMAAYGSTKPSLKNLRKKTTPQNRPSLP